MNDIADGIYAAMTEEAYRALPYVNASSIKAGRTSMQHMKLAMSGVSESSAAKELGTITHAMLLEPAKLDRVVVAPDFGDLRTKAAKEAKAAWTAGLPAGAIIVDVETYQAAQGMVEACRRHQTMRDLLAADGSSELVLVWTDAESGLRCKARVDRLIHHHLVLDVKTARAAGSFAFTRAVAAYGYHRRAAALRLRRAREQRTLQLLPLRAGPPGPRAGRRHQLADTAAVGRLRRIWRVYFYPAGRPGAAARAARLGLLWCRRRGRHLTPTP